MVTDRYERVVKFNQCKLSIYDNCPITGLGDLVAFKVGGDPVQGNSMRYHCSMFQCFLTALI